MTDDEILQQYCNILPFLSKVMGNGCELVIHDTRDLEHSLIAIENGLSGRKLGDPLTELAKGFIDKFENSDVPYKLNYTGYVKQAQFLDSTYFIRNDENHIIGFLCVNKDLRYTKSINNSLKAFIDAFNLQQPQKSEYEETLNVVVDQMVSERIENIIRSSGISVERMTTKNKIKIINTLKESGVLDLKGAIAETAFQLNVSIPTIYRYIKKTE